MIQGIDVSQYQGEIRWQDVKDEGVEFAIVRTTLRLTDGTLATDPNAIANITGAQSAGVYAGAYHYTRARTVAEAEEEARYFLSVIEPYRLEYPVALDLEDNSLTGLGKENLTNIANAFLETVQDAGYYVMLYSNKYWLTTLLDVDELRQYDVWLAQYPTVTYTGPYGIWQYTPAGRVNGISTNVDMDYAYQDYAQIIRDAGLNGFPKPGCPEDPCGNDKPEGPDHPGKPEGPGGSDKPEKPGRCPILLWLKKLAQLFRRVVDAVRNWFG
ncbi:glycoside hydrolase family 25 protein [Zongyangia hominis]|uniref:Endolysin n=1 Tax=Zongyangia hominis TaxID=2763677 RepID=A0A926E7L1_9FIRM|nr:glycoside hydrolase family 25 protein [Zongyangia hominis]MBC8569315.1 endolysin [Zongyangia hominis]